MPSHVGCAIFACPSSPATPLPFSRCAPTWPNKWDYEGGSWSDIWYIHACVLLPTSMAAYMQHMCLAKHCHGPCPQQSRVPKVLSTTYAGGTYMQQPSREAQGDTGVCR